jgi:rSAM/selenodomain-associated transferase 2
MTSPTTLAVVIPALDEAARLARTLQSLHAQTLRADRLIVVDGGSKDETPRVAAEQGAESITAARCGRGGQIAAGVASVREDLVLVGHGDMQFPPDAIAAIREAMARQPTCPGGCLGHRFDSPKRIYRLIEWMDRRRAVRGMSYGDQAQFFRREWLQRAGGFPAQPIMEDVELSRRMCSLGPCAYLDRPVIVSARRFEERGWLRVLLANWRFRRAYRHRGLAACRCIYERYYGRPWPYSLE